MKECKRCRKSLPEKDFPWKKKEVTRAAWCKPCQREFARGHYASNKEYYKDKANRNNKKYYDANKQVVIEYLKANPCIDCGESDIEVLQFDHREPLRQRGGRVGSFLHYSTQYLMKEIAKCDVVCANCHVRRTRKTFGFERTLLS